jgi:hypothetical protein
MRIKNDNSITRHPGAGRPNTYPFHNLKPGEEITIPVGKDDHSKYRAMRVSTALTGWKKRNNATDWKTAVRSTDDAVIVFRFKE